MTLHRVYRQLDDPADLRRIEVFLIAQREHDPLHLRQTRDEAAEPAIEQRVAYLGRRLQIVNVVEVDEMRTSLANLIDASPRRHLAQPEGEMRRRLDGAEAAEHLQKNLLRQFL